MKLIARICFMALAMVLMGEQGLLHAIALSSDKQARVESGAIKQPTDSVTKRDNASSEPFSWQDVYLKTNDAVVQIFACKGIPDIFHPYKPPQQALCKGTAFFINSDGYLLSNFHVVASMIGLWVEVPSLGKQRFEVEVVRCKPGRDLALLRLKPAALERLRKQLSGGAINYLKFGNSDELKKAQEVMALGFPLTEEGLKTTIGVISGKDRVLGRYYVQITAPINFGNSGGPTVDLEGRVIGINSKMITNAQNIGFMIPSNDVESFVQDFFDKEKEAGALIERMPNWGFCHTRSTNEEMRRYYGSSYNGGVYINYVVQDGLLGKAGLKEGDILCKVDKYELDSYGYVYVEWCEDKVHFRDILDRFHIGDSFVVVVDRKGQLGSLHVTVEAGTPQKIDSFYYGYEPLDYAMLSGAVITPLTRDHVSMMAALESFIDIIEGEYGLEGIIQLPILEHIMPQNSTKPCLFISDVLINSQAHKNDLLQGKVLTHLNEQPVSTLDELADALRVSCKTGYVVFKTEDGMVTVLDVGKILEEEDYLMQIFHYPPSPLIEILKQGNSSIDRIKM